MQLREISSTKWAVRGLIGGGAAIVFITLILMSQNSQEQETPLSIPPIPSGATQVSSVENAIDWPDATLEVSKRGEVYVVYSGNPQKPEILEVALDPFDAQVGEEQTILVKVLEKGVDITRDNTADVEVIGDNGSEVIFLRLKKIEDPNLTITWQGAWIVDDTHESKYSAVVTATNASNTNSITLSFK